MGTKRRAVVNADATDLRRVEELVASGRYRTVSDFVREAVHEKLARAEAEVLHDEVARYCAAGHADEDLDLIRAQAFDGPQQTRAKPKTPRPLRKGRRATG